jgi:hypothetical protein
LLLVVALEPLDQPVLAASLHILAEVAVLAVRLSNTLQVLLPAILLP